MIGSDNFYGCDICGAVAMGGIVVMVVVFLIFLKVSVNNLVNVVMHLMVGKGLQDLMFYFCFDIFDSCDDHDGCATYFPCYVFYCCVGGTVYAELDSETRWGSSLV